jgi:hypothetical protein
MAQDTIISTKLQVVIGEIINEDSIKIIVNRKIQNDNIKQVFDVSEILQIKYGNGQIKFFEKRVIEITPNSINSNLNTQNDPNSVPLIYSRPYRPIGLKKSQNYTFVKKSGELIPATYLGDTPSQYIISQDSAKIVFLDKNHVIDLLPCSYELNENKILKCDKKYLFHHKFYNDLEINYILKNLNDKEINELVIKAKKKIIFGKAILVSGILPALLIVSGVVVVLADVLIQDESLFYTGISISGIGILATIPFLTSGILILNDGKFINKKAVDIYNKKY